jgi:hypothetical protein
VNVFAHSSIASHLCFSRVNLIRLMAFDWITLNATSLINPLYSSEEQSQQEHRNASPRLSSLANVSLIELGDQLPADLRHSTRADLPRCSDVRSSVSVGQRQRTRRRFSDLGVVGESLLFEHLQMTPDEWIRQRIRSTSSFDVRLQRQSETMDHLQHAR